jgi:Flp pilus assembly protein TadD
MASTARALALALAAALVLVLGGLTQRQSRVYHDLETLCRDTIARNPQAWNAYVNLALHLIGAGRSDEAAAVARAGLAVRPDVAELHSALAGALWHSGATAAQAEEIVFHFRKAIELRPDYVENLENLAIVLAALNRHEEASVYFSRARAAREAEGP